MTTTVRPSGLRGWSIRCVMIAMSVAFCASAFAGSEISAPQRNKMQAAQNAARKLCYVQLGFGIPQPCERFAGPVVTTANPMDIIGRVPR